MAWKRVTKAGAGAGSDWLIDDPIYKTNQMHTVPPMLKRILTLALGAALGLVLAAVTLRVASAWGFLPNRELNRSADYVSDVLKLVHENYVDAGETGYDQLARKAIHGMVDSLDSHSEFLEADQFGDFEDDLDGDFCGIGVQVEYRNERIVVIAPMAGAPAERAGILRGDEIIKVDGQLLGQKSPMDEAIRRLRGKPNTKVVVGIRRPGSDKLMEMTLVREIIEVVSVREAKLLSDDMGYIQLADFSAHTGEQFLAALGDLLKQGAQGLIIDLRNNPGGLLESAVEVAEPFFNEDELVVYTQGRRPEDREDLLSQMHGPPVQIPLAVLINSGTASAAEIVTGALKDTQRAVVVGERSFGKGSVQTIFKLRHGEGMRITTAHYFTPSGVSIHGKGITPHIEVIMTPEEDNKLRLQKVRSDVSDLAEFKERFGFSPIKDRQLQTAIDALKGVMLLSKRSGAVKIKTPVGP
jgi:carboxyl-terminal processing protease